MSKDILMLDSERKELAQFKSIQDASEQTGISRIRISRCARGIRKFIEDNGKILKFEYIKA